MKIVQVIRLTGVGGYVPDNIVALFDDGTLWEGQAHTVRYDDNRLREFVWKQIKFPSLPGAKDGL